jgi:hypothetical protein
VVRSPGRAKIILLLKAPRAHLGPPSFLVMGSGGCSGVKWTGAYLFTSGAEVKNGRAYTCTLSFACENVALVFDIFPTEYVYAYFLWFLV